MTLELGDHVWYWNGRISFAQDIPRAEWFPGSNPHVPTDYQGHGSEIYNYVIHADEIARGRPHMRNHGGSFAWLNNNPGNLTGRPGGPDYGQYPGKFNWHNFMVFPSWSAGYDAIALRLRKPDFIDLSILDAFKKYAPESDGNRPVEYANAVAAALGVSVATRVGDLDDGQMIVMQNKIQEIEGAIPGDSLSWYSDDIPAEIAKQLQWSLRKERRPEAIRPRTEPFTIDMSAPVDPAGFTQGLGGPGQGGHSGEWYNGFGMDLGAEEGTPVYAAFDAHVTVFHPHNPQVTTGPVYGAQIFMRSPNDMMGAYYTHISDVPSWLVAGARVSRGDFLGRVLRQAGITPHLHMALLEFIGGAPGGQKVGVDLYRLFLQMESFELGSVVPIQFWQDGSPPEPIWRAGRVGQLFGLTEIQEAATYAPKRAVAE
jgi:murein DD-endopeptidase MepM/ murein hydrolase activator NlpD